MRHMIRCGLCTAHAGCLHVLTTVVHKICTFLAVGPSLQFGQCATWCSPPLVWQLGLYAVCKVPHWLLIALRTVHHTGLGRGVLQVDTFTATGIVPDCGGGNWDAILSECQARSGRAFSNRVLAYFCVLQFQVVFIHWSQALAQCEQQVEGRG